MGSGNERGGGNELGERRAEQFPHVGNNTLIPGFTGEYVYKNSASRWKKGGASRRYAVYINWISRAAAN